MPKRIDLTGQRFGRLVVEGFAYKAKDGHSMWKCRCECGKVKVVNGTSLKLGKSQSCGCLHNELLSDRNFKHGGRNTRLYYIWCGMIERTETENQVSYKNYGGRGIKVCEEWRISFEKFRDWALKHGYQDELTIDRIDVNGNYCPKNCKWSTAKEQARNKRNNAKITYKGKTQALAQWSEELGIRQETLWHRLNTLGWPVEKTFETPVRKQRRK